MGIQQGRERSWEELVARVHPFCQVEVIGFLHQGVLATAFLQTFPKRRF